MKNKLYLIVAVSATIGFLSSIQAKENGGMQNPYAWMCTFPVDGKENSQYMWKDKNGNDITLDIDGVSYINSRAEISTYNFYPALTFSDDQNSVLRLSNGLQKATLIGVYGYTSPEDHESDGFLMNVYSGADNDETVVTKTRIVHTVGSSRKSFIYKDRNLVCKKPSSLDDRLNIDGQKSIRIMSYTKSSNPRSIASSSFSNINIGGKYVDGVTSKKDAFSVDSLPDKERAKVSASIPEFLVYDRALTDTARKRVESYLALKYAITLDTDYMLDTTVWNINEGYFNRVCGYGRVDKYYLNQSVVTTSEREAPLYLRETFFEGNSYNKSAYENLLVMGRIGEFEDNTLIMYGDNNASFEINRKDTLFVKPADAANFVISEDSVAYFPIERMWKVKNFGKSFGQQVREKLQLSDATVIDTFADSYDIVLNPEASIKIEDLKVFRNNGEISWVSDALNGSVYVSIGICNIKFLSDGKISINGKIMSQTYAKGDMLEIVKKDSVVYIRKNGVFIPNSIVVEKNKDCEWSVEMVSNGNKFAIHQFHYVSDLDNSDFVELSYDYADSLSFFSNGNIYLICSKSKDIKSDASELRIYKMSSKDRPRSKVLFENLAWDEGESYFTFAISGNPEFKIADPKYNVYINTPKCDDTNNTNGKIQISFPEDGTYSYMLINEWGGAIAQGLLLSGSVDISNLQMGKYTLYLAPYDGIHKYDISGYSKTPETISMKRSFDRKELIAAEWIVGDANETSICGLSNNPLSQIKWGVKISEFKISKVDAGKESSEYFPVKNGDVVRLEAINNGKQFNVKINGDVKFVMDNTDISGLSYYWTITTSNGATVKRLTFSSMSVDGYVPVVVNASKENFVNSAHLSFCDAGLKLYPLDLICEETDDKEKEIKEDPIEFVEEESNQNIYVLSSMDGSKNVTVKAKLNNTYSAMAIVYDYWSRNIVSESGMSIGSDGYFNGTFYIANQGAYIVTVKSYDTDEKLDAKFIVK